MVDLHTLCPAPFAQHSGSLLAAYKAGVYTLAMACFNKDTTRAGFNTTGNRFPAVAAAALTHHWGVHPCDLYKLPKVL